MEGPLTRRPPVLHSTPWTLAVKLHRIQVMTIQEIGVIANEEVDNEGETGMDGIRVDVDRRPRGLPLNPSRQRSMMELRMYKLITGSYKKAMLTCEMAKSRAVKKSSSCCTILQGTPITFTRRKLP